jgi:hypothetical protein
VDTITITTDRLHLDGEVPFHDYRRVKTGQKRMATLWPETVLAIREYIDDRPLFDGRECTLIVAKGGVPYSCNSGNFALCKDFRRQLDRIGGYPPGVGLGSLRHVYGTVVDLVPDQAIIDLTMGHVGQSLQKRVYSQFHINFLNRLKVVADTVRRWLYYGKMEVNYADSKAVG